MAFRLKQVLYQAPDASYLEDTLRLCGRVPGWEVDVSGEPPTLSWPDLQIRFARSKSPAETLGLLACGYFNLLVLDLRVRPGDQAGVEGRVQAAHAFFDRLGAMDVEERYGTHRILAIVSGEDGDAVDQLIAHLGRHGVARVLRDPGGAERGAFGERLLREMRRIMLERIPGKSALCLAGGAITGLFFEVGALKCIEDCLPPQGLNKLDMYFGISAGAVIAGVVANGFKVEELMLAIAGHEDGRIPPLDLKLLRFANLNFRDMFWRVGHAAAQLAKGAVQVATRKAPPGLSSFFGSYPDWIGPPLRPDRFEHRMREVFSQPGASNDFRDLQCELYVCATDQDRRVEVIFGDEGHAHVPISKAIEASLSLNPAFSSTEIDGRYYTDGAVTRTSNFTEAIHKKADFVLCIDPFLPYVSKEPGFVRRRGLLYNVDQDVRTMSFTRFEKARNAVLPANPHVSMYTFLPANHVRRLLSENPMDHRPYLTIWRAAYLSTLRRLEAVQHRLSGDLLPRGLTLDLSRARAVAERLAATESPTVRDFFVDRRAEPRLVSETEAAPAAPPRLRTVG